MPRIKKPTHLLCEVALQLIANRGDTLIQQNSIQGISVGDVIKGRKVLGFVNLRDYNIERVFVVREGNGRYNKYGLVDELKYFIERTRG